MTDGSLYVAGEGHDARIVGPAPQAAALAAAMNDDRLQVAFLPDVDPMILTAAAMAPVAVDFPVLVLPEQVRVLWDAEAASRPRIIEEYTGKLPRLREGAGTSFGIVRPGDRS